MIKDVWADGPTAPEVELGPRTRFIEDLQIDSLASIEMVIAAEAAYGIEIPDGEVDHIRTIQEAVDYLERKIAKDVPSEEKDGL